MIRRRWVLTGCLTAVLAALTACTGSGSHASATTNHVTSSAPSHPSSSASSPHSQRPPGALPTFAVYYQAIRSSAQLAKLGPVNVVVTTRQHDDAAAAKAIHEHGAKAFRYVQSYWFPAGGTYDGLDISKHMDWAYCKAGGQPLVGRVQGSRKWYFLDANERAARQWFATLLKKLRADGYDGIMFDRGLAALTGEDSHPAGIWDKSSTCTSDPVQKGATFADAYVGLMSEVHKAGLQLFQNYGYSPFTPQSPFRPDPRDPQCQAGKFATCRHLDDAFQYVDYFLDEAPAHPKDQLWQQDYDTNLANERSKDFHGKVAALITQGTLGGDASRSAVFFEFARIRLFDVPVAIFTGDDKCGGATGLCNRQGIYEKLTTADFGKPTAPLPAKTNCESGSSIHCVWTREYQDGVSVANVSPQATSATVHITGGCAKVTDLYSGQALEGGQCVNTVALRLPPWSGRPLLLQRES